ncbi:uncharacterized protein [Palaemon carinicauda]|uniref:uncharacterized protein n=1 Tax=Palaemon carinicauda TaxID=392227 RepID=UPI0035B65DE7
MLVLHWILPSVCLALSSTCQSQADCSTGEYCENRYAYTCQCLNGYVTVGETCLPERNKGEPCVDDKQCPHDSLICYQSICSCLNGRERPDGTCLESAKLESNSEPPPPANLQAIGGSSKHPKKESGKIQAVGGGYTGAIAICALVFISFAVLIATTAYNFRMRNRRLEEVRSILDAHAVSVAQAPNARRASIGSIRDAPPSYQALSPPSYEQATGQSINSPLRPVPSPMRAHYLSLETAPTPPSGEGTSTSASASCASSNGITSSNKETASSLPRRKE